MHIFFLKITFLYEANIRVALISFFNNKDKKTHRASVKGNYTSP